jgi:hypothetical protein
MTWLAWRQFRAQAVTAAAVLAVFAVVLVATGPRLANLYAASGVAGCHGATGCGRLADSFLGRVNGVYPVVYVLGIAGIVVAPAVIGIFWGAPLVAREFEAGTFRLAWTQSITRTCWLAVRLTLVGLAAVAVTGALSVMHAWWAAPIGQAARLASNSNFPLGMGPFSLLAFGAHGVTPLGYAAFAFALGVTAGTFIRRAIPAMALTLAIFAAVQVAMPLAIRPHLFPPRHVTAELSSFSSLPTQIGPGGTFAFSVYRLPSQPGAWILSSGAVNAAGQPVSTSAACKSYALNASPAWSQCLTSHGIRIAVTYQPTSRYWPLQWTETAIYLALAMALAGYCFWRLNRRLS